MSVVPGDVFKDTNGGRIGYRGRYLVVKHVYESDDISVCDVYWGLCPDTPCNPGFGVRLSDLVSPSYRRVDGLPRPVDASATPPLACDDRCHFFQWEGMNSRREVKEGVCYAGCPGFDKSRGVTFDHPLRRCVRRKRGEMRGSRVCDASTEDLQTRAWRYPRIAKEIERRAAAPDGGETP